MQFWMKAAAETPLFGYGSIHKIRMREHPLLDVCDLLPEIAGSRES